MMNFGIQKRAEWTGSDDRAIALLDVDGQGQQLTRVSAWGEATFELVWGTQGTGRIANIRSPMVAYVPGSVTVTARPLVAGQGVARVTAHPADPGESFIRVFFNSTGPLPPHAVRAQCVAAGTLSTCGTVVALNVGESIILGGPSAVVSGSFLVEMEI